MNEQVNKHGSWEEVIVDFFENNIASSNLYKSRDYISKKNREIESEKDEVRKAKLIYDRDKKTEELNKHRIMSPLSEIPKWLEKSSNKSGSIKKATHVLRFTHSSSVADGVFLTEKSEDRILSTSSLKNRSYDMAHNNGALVSISRFLALKNGATTIFDEIIKGGVDFLRPFSTDEEKIKKWSEGFNKLVVKETEIRTADKAKQIYFPLNNENSLDDKGGICYKNYHLVIPIFSSTLAEEIYSRQTVLRFGEEQKIIREEKKGGSGVLNITSRYHQTPLIEFPHLAVQKFGGAQPQNVSMLNKGRSWKADKKDKITWGVTYLFDTRPPTWQSQLKPPIKSRSLFGRGFHLPGVKEDIDYLCEYLLRFERIDLSVKNPERLKWIEKWVRSISDEFLIYVASIQKFPAGWSNSRDIALKPEHQYLLDPFRQDDKFQVDRKACEWQAVVCDDFGWWLNTRLRGKDKKFTPQPEHRYMWAKLLESPLREHNDIVEFERKRKAGVGT